MSRLLVAGLALATEEIEGTGTLVFGWSGQFYARGGEMVVRVLGGKIEFTAEGTGTAFLCGCGVYIIDHHPGRWSLEGVRFELGGSEE